MTRSTSSRAPSARKDEAAERARVLADIDARLAGDRSPEQELIARWQNDADVQRACALVSRAVNARTRFGQDRTPLPLPSGLPLPPV